MNYVYYRSRLEIQMYLYIDFLPSIKLDENYSKKQKETMTFKLLDEIQFLKLRIMKLDRMKLGESHNQVVFKPSKAISKIHEL